MQTLDIFTRLRLMMNRIKMPAVFYWHIRYGLFFPPGVVMNTIVGRGIGGNKKYESKE
jgi:hypothetical protein